ncbi:MAG: hypothetical protein EU549_02095 [Promethearchaeota archaeon]|nr:MAG: hypothetical protein EU549_02095 [Candidatus Lokiarchaeota archaeon]
MFKKLKDRLSAALGISLLLTFLVIFALGYDFQFFELELFYLLIVLPYLVGFFIFFFILMTLYDYKERIKTKFMIREEQKNLSNNIERYIEQYNLEKAEELIKDINKIFLRKKLKKKLLDKYIEVIKADLDKAERLISYREIQKATWTLNKIQEIINEKKLQTFQKDINDLREKIEELKLQRKLENKRKIRKIILNLSTKKEKLYVSEISEESGINKDNLIIGVIKEMLKNDEIYGEYFTNSRSISFDIQHNIAEIDKLMSVFREWEKGNIGKKN